VASVFLACEVCEFASSERVCYQKFAGGEERGGKEETCFLPLLSFIQWSACWALPPKLTAKTVEATIDRHELE
jgi:hypothetical protein